MSVTSTPSRSCILLADDDEISLAVTGAHLRALGHEVVAVVGGRAAVDAIAEGAFDLVVTDLAMPEVDGLEVLAAATARRADLPVIVLSGRSDTRGVLDAIHSGAFDYVLKDGESSPLVAAVERALRQVHLARQNRELMERLTRANELLEAEVAERTTQLRQSNRQLRAERSELESTVRQLQSTQLRLVQAEKVASVGMLTAGVAHEVNNPLAFLANNIEFIRDWVVRVADHGAAEPSGDLEPLPDLIDEAQDVLDTIDDCQFGFDRIAGIANQLKNFARPTDSEPQCLDPAVVVDALVRLTRPQLRDAADIECNLEDSCPVRAVPGHAQQILLNLVVNAAHAIPDDRRGRIELLSRREGAWVAIDVTDNGVGIADALRERIFEPFFTTRPDGDGTGLGLSISKELAEKMGGSLTCASVVGEGTTMTLRLPCWSEAAPQAATP